MKVPKHLGDACLIQFSDAAMRYAQEYAVTPYVHAEDYIFNALYVLRNRNLDSAAWHYYMSGRTSVEKIRLIVALHWNRSIQKDRLGIQLSMLDFASGYGCVTRHMSNVFPNVNVMAMDIHQQACDFNREYLGLNTAMSKTKPDELEVFSKFDMVFALSFFSHMPKKTFLPWLAKLTEFVRPGGLLVFTTHGEESHKTQMPQVQLDQDGYGFIAESEQFDLSTEDYVHAVTYRGFVLDQIRHLADMDLRMYFKAFWWLHQDAYVLQKVSGS